MSALARPIGLCVRVLRKQRGLTQAELAALVNRSEAFIRAIEYGTSEPSLETLARLVQALDVPPAALFPVLRSGDGARSCDAERRTQEIAAIMALTQSFNDADLALALALVTALAEAATGPRHEPAKQGTGEQE